MRSLPLLGLVSLLCVLAMALPSTPLPSLKESLDLEAPSTIDLRAPADVGVYVKEATSITKYHQNGLQTRDPNAAAAAVYQALTPLSMLSNSLVKDGNKPLAYAVVAIVISAVSLSYVLVFALVRFTMSIQLDFMDIWIRREKQENEIEETKVNKLLLKNRMEEAKINEERIKISWVSLQNDAKAIEVEEEELKARLAKAQDTQAGMEHTRWQREREKENAKLQDQREKEKHEKEMQKVPLEMKNLEAQTEALGRAKDDAKGVTDYKIALAKLEKGLKEGEDGADERRKAKELFAKSQDEKFDADVRQETLHQALKLLKIAGEKLDKRQKELRECERTLNSLTARSPLSDAIEEQFRMPGSYPERRRQLLPSNLPRFVEKKEASCDTEYCHLVWLGNHQPDSANRDTSPDSIPYGVLYDVHLTPLDFKFTTDEAIQYEGVNKLLDSLPLSEDREPNESLEKPGNQKGQRFVRILMENGGDSTGLGISKLWGGEKLFNEWMANIESLPKITQGDHQFIGGAVPGLNCWKLNPNAGKPGQPEEPGEPGKPAAYVVYTISDKPNLSYASPDSILGACGRVSGP